jgi:hypothetical protein
MNILTFARMIVAAQGCVVKYEKGETICPVCRELGLPPARCTVTCTVKEVRYMCCSQCLSTFRSIGEAAQPPEPVKIPEPAPVKTPQKQDKNKKIKHNITESKEQKDEKPKRNRKRTSAV